jgi:putative ABC transport system permease protein
MNAAPPSLAARLLAWRLSPAWREYVLGDLEEAFHARAAVSPRAARAWYWRQALRCLAAPPAAPAITPPSPNRDPFMLSIAADLRYALRVLLRTPSFAFAVIAVLALGIGANTAIFSIVNAVLLRPLPFNDADRMVRLYHVPPQDTFPGMPTFPLSPANFYDWKRSARLFEEMAVYRFRPFILTGGTGAREVLAAAVGDGFFDVVGMQPALGRVFLPEEDAPGRGQVVVLSDGFWKRHFGAAPDVVGRTLRLDGDAYRVVGVMPPQFSVTAWAATARDLWVPVAYTDAQRAVRENHNVQGIARLRSGVSVEQGRAEVEQISRRLEQEYPKDNAGWGGTVIPLHEVIVGDIRRPLIVLLAAVGLVLLIACANVGNLLFARALARRKEIAIRSALGAGQGRVFQQLLVESLVLAAAGGAAGLVLARVALGAASTLLADQLPRADEISLDARVLLFALGASVLTGVLAGALPALRAGRTDLNDALKEGGRNDSAIGTRTRRLLIVAEVALSLVLLMGAAVMVRSLLALRSVDAGYDPRGVLTFRVSLPETRYDTPAKVEAFFDAALARVRALPGVEAVGGIDDLPTAGGSQQPIVREGQAELLPRDQPTVAVRKITPGYLGAMRIPILRGRDVDPRDSEAMLVSESAAKLLWGDDDPIGRRVTLPLQSRTVLKEVVGIVGDIKQGSLSEPAAPSVYELTRAHGGGSVAVVVRTAVPPMSIAPQATDIIRALDPEQPVEEIRTMEAVVDQTLTAQRFSALLLGLFAAVALLLASVGIYSVLSYIVRGRSREIGIRTALGARTPDVVRLVMVEGMTPALIGVGAGVIASIASGQLLQTVVFGVSAWDPLTLAAVGMTLTVVALLATLLPAYRAARVDPLIVLRGN